ncbi:hypothetical protein BDQ17DRAFT_1435314 [Cyathus striatus]|nr:hypothetical protein BDQ17DRAFT_1435314 [Cyathus striatus]
MSSPIRKQICCIFYEGFRAGRDDERDIIFALQTELGALHPTSSFTTGAANVGWNRLLLSEPGTSTSTHRSQYPKPSYNSCSSSAPSPPPPFHHLPAVYDYNDTRRLRWPTPELCVGYVVTIVTRGTWGKREQEITWRYEGRQGDRATNVAPTPASVALVHPPFHYPPLWFPLVFRSTTHLNDLPPHANSYTASPPPHQPMTALSHPPSCHPSLSILDGVSNPSSALLRRCRDDTAGSAIANCVSRGRETKDGGG